MRNERKLNIAVALAIVVLIVALLWFAAGAIGATSYNQCAASKGVYYTQCMSARRAIYAVWGDNAALAMDITACETGRTWNLWAKNGQYWGLFQMGTKERRRWGHGWNVWAQARSAYAYFKSYGVEPWRSCI